jgi:hypothetical protein
MTTALARHVNMKRGFQSTTNTDQVIHFSDRNETSDIRRTASALHKEHPTTIMTAHPAITVNEASGVRSDFRHKISELILQDDCSQAMNLLDDRRVKSVRPLIP